MEAARHLRVIDADGVELDRCPACAKFEDQVKGLERDLRSWRARYADLARDKEAEAQRSRYWPAALEVFNYWQEVCRHPRSSWGADRFYLIEPYIKKHGAELCKRAVDGAAFDPFITTRKNGSKKRHDGFDLIFRSPEKFEEFVNRAPKVAAA